VVAIPDFASWMEAWYGDVFKFEIKKDKK